jgi:hypothetical protein
MKAVLPGGLIRAVQVQVGFVDERRCAEGVIGSLAPQVPVCQPP